MENYRKKSELRHFYEPETSYNSATEHNNSFEFYPETLKHEIHLKSSQIELGSKDDGSFPKELLLSPVISQMKGSTSSCNSLVTNSSKRSLDLSLTNCNTHFCRCKECNSNSSKSQSTRKLCQKTLNDSAKLTPEKNNKIDASLQETSPVLKSSFPSRKTYCQKLHSSTFANLNPITTSPESIKTNLVLNNAANSSPEKNKKIDTSLQETSPVLKSSFLSRKKCCQMLHAFTPANLNPSTTIPKSIKIDLVLNDSANLSPEENKKIDTSLQEISPVLNSPFTSTKKCNLKFHASTPAKPNPITISPDRIKTELVLNVLDRLCSPVSVKTSSKTETHNFQSLSESCVKNETDYTRLKTAKRLFSDTCKGSSIHHSQSKRKKLVKENKTMIKEINEPNDSDVSDPFKEYDISENTLQILCEATNYIDDHLELSDIMHEKYLQKNQHGQDNGIKHKKVLRVVSKSNVDDLTPLSEESTDKGQEISVNIGIKTPVKSDLCCNSVLYSTLPLGINGSNKFSLNDLFVDIKVLEEANKPNDSKLISNRKLVLQSDIINKSNLFLCNLSSTNESVKELHGFRQLAGKLTKSTEEITVNDSVSITDTQFCEAAEAAEMITDLDQTFNNFTCQTTSPEKKSTDAMNYVLNETADIFHKFTSCEENSFKTIQNPPHSLFDEESCKKLPFGQAHSAKSEVGCLKAMNRKCSEVNEESLKEQANLFESKCPNSGFIASDESVEIRDESPKKTRYLISDKRQCEEVTVKDCHIASFETIEIFNESIKNANQLFDKQGSLEGHTNLVEGFITGSGKAVKVSHESLQITKQLFDNANYFNTAEPQGFKTASGRSVKVSNKSLNKSKLLFDNENGFKESELNQNANNIEVNKLVENERQLFYDKDNFDLFKSSTFQTVSVGKARVSQVNESKHLFDDYESHSNKLEMQSFLPYKGKTEQGFNDVLKNTEPKFEDQCNNAKDLNNAFDKSIEVLDELAIGQIKHLFDSEISEMRGFQTAGGRTVEISSESLETARCFFDNEYEFEKCHMKGFETASGKTVKISDKSLEKAKRIFCNPEDSTMEGFKTAGGKKIELSNDSLNKAKLLFTNEKYFEESEIKNFQTGSDETIQINIYDNSLNKARVLFKDCNSEKHTIDGFKTASGKLVKISDESVRKARKLFDDQRVSESYSTKQFNKTSPKKSINISNESLNVEKSPNSHKNHFKNPNLNCFETANGKTIGVSDESLKKVKQLFGEDTQDEFLKTEKELFDEKFTQDCTVSDELLKKVKRLYDAKFTQECAANGFQTSCGITSQISDESLKNKKIFYDNKLHSEEHLVKGFKTASGKFVDISNESLNKARKFFDEPCTSEVGSVDQFKTVPGKSDKTFDKSLKLGNENNFENPKLMCFQTASGKTMGVSDESLKKVKQLFGEEKTQDESLKIEKQLFDEKCTVSDESLKKVKQLFDAKFTQDCAANGFQTSCGITSQISDECLKNKKMLYDNKLHSEEHLVKGFKTASGKFVDISNGSLNKARKFFDVLCTSEVGSVDQFKTVPGKSDKTFDKSLKLGNENNFENPKLMCFQTASGKTIGVSDESLKKVKQLFGEEKTQDEYLKIEKQLFDEKCTVSDESLKKVKQLFDAKFTQDCAANGFQTSCGITSQISDECLKYKKMLYDNKLHSEEHLVKGFKTASGKFVDISNESLNKARKFFDEPCTSEVGSVDQFKTVPGKNVNTVDKSLKLHDENCFKKPEFNCFQTAGGKTVKVSDESLNSVRQLFDIETNLEVGKAKSFQSDSSLITVQLSNESPRKSEHLFGHKSSFKEHTFKGFQTGSGRFVEVSKKSLKKAKQLFDDPCVVESCSNEGSTTTSGKADVLFPTISKKVIDEEYNFETPEFKSFTNIASSKTVKEYQEQLKKAELSFDDKVHYSNKPLINGFQTASGNSVHFSDESLEKARHLFENDISENHGFKGHIKTPSSTFTDLSDESLKRARELFVSDCLVDHTTEIAYTNLKINSPVHDTLICNNVSNLIKNQCDFPVKKVVIDDSKILQLSDNSTRNSRKLIESELYAANFVRRNILQDACPKQILNKIHSKTPTDRCLLISSDNNYISEDTHAKTTKYLDKTNSTMKTGKRFVCSSSDMHEKEKSIKRRKLFDDTVHEKEIRDNFYPEAVGDTSTSNIYSSVISNEDLNLLNQSLTNSGFHFNCSSKPSGNGQHSTDVLNLLSPSVAREISESMAALVADEESNSSFLLRPCLTTPAMIFDRNVKLPSIDCDEKDSHLNNKPLSPILDSYSHFKRFKKHLRTSAEYDKVLTPITKTGSFKPPYATSTPNEYTGKPNIKFILKDLNNKIVVEKTTNSIHKDISTCFLTSTSVARKKSAEKQEQSIQGKHMKLKFTKTCKGSYLLRKQTEIGRNLLSIADGGSLRFRTIEQLLNLDVKKSVVDISSRNAHEFKFFARDYFSEETSSTNVDGIAVGDGALLILDGEGRAGIVEVTRAFLASPFVDPSLVSSEWVTNHFKWIVLKLAAMERMFPEKLANRHLTPNNLLLQLKYRYDREIDRCQRPALRKVLEKDESPAKTMVLFVADILNIEFKECGQKKELELSDGWYSVKASIDYEMESLIRKNVVNVGTKLLITGADVVNNDDGCHPLETPPDVRLRVSTNSCRRVRWHTRLGFYHRFPSSVRLHGVLGRGGTVPGLTAVVARTYPLLFLEKLQEGKTVIRGERAEQVAADAYQLKRQQCAEVILSQLQRDLEHSKTNNKQPVTRRSIKQVKNTSELYSLIESVDDISVFQEVLSKDQLSLIQEHRQEETSKIQQQLQEKLVKQLDKDMVPRVVTRMLKVRLVDTEKQLERSALLTVWNPSDDVLSLLTEGNSLVFHNLSASGFSRFGDLQLTGGRQTRYSLEKRFEVPRSSTSLSTLCSTDFKPQFSEMDVAGIVIPDVDTGPDSNSKLVYIADTNYNFLGISFWTELKDTGYASLITPGSLITASNLHWRSNLVSWSLPSAFATEMSTFSQHPRQAHLQESLKELAEYCQSLNLETYIDDCLKRIQSLLAHRNSAGLIPTSNTTGSTPCKSINEQESTRMKAELPSSSKENVEDVTQNVNTPTNRKLLLLKKYGEPPPISPLLLSTPSRVKQNFRPPIKKSLGANR